MPENLTHSLSFLKRASDKKEVYHHFISRNPDILKTVVNATSHGIHNIESILKDAGQNTAECGNYEYTLLKDNMRLIRSELFDGLFNSVLIKGNTLNALRIPVSSEVIALDNAVEINKDDLTGHDCRLFQSLKIVIEGVITTIPTDKISAELQAFLENSYAEQDNEITADSEKHLDKRAFDLIFNEKDTDTIRSAEYLIKAMLEVAKSELTNKSLLNYTGISISKDVSMETLTLIIEKEDEKIYTLDSRNNEFYITNRKTLQKTPASDYKGDGEEAATFRIAEQFLRAVDGQVDANDFFNKLLNSR